MKKTEWLLVLLCAAALTADALFPPVQRAQQPLREQAGPVQRDARRRAAALWLGNPPVDVNAADATELDTLPGIGPVLAERIVAYRQEHGPFTAAEELLNVRGVGEVTLQGLLDAGA